MRIVYTIILATALTLMLSFIWYISQPIVITSANVAEDISEAGDWDTTGSTTMYTLTRLGMNIGIALAILFIWVWAAISAQYTDMRGEESQYV